VPSKTLHNQILRITTPRAASQLRQTLIVRLQTISRQTPTVSNSTETHVSHVLTSTTFLLRPENALLSALSAWTTIGRMDGAHLAGQDILLINRLDHVSSKTKQTQTTAVRQAPTIINRTSRMTRTVKPGMEQFAHSVMLSSTYRLRPVVVLQ